jgi:NAD(P)-dependent dehydrogenase (short-subunit alcohol dehydrogenase family)
MPEANPGPGHAPVLGGRTALVFGGGSGIGLGVARWLLADGASVVIASRDEQRLDNAVGVLRSVAPSGTTVGRVVCDATEEASVAATVAAVAELDICVSAVGGGTLVPLLLCSAEAFMADLTANLLSTFLTIKYSAIAMAARGGGTYVAISSDAGAMSFPYVGPYCAAKAGVDALVRVAADELASTKVRFNSVRPGLVRTERNAHLTEDEQTRQRFVDEKPLNRLGSVDDVAAAVRYLAGPESSWVTGVSFPVDGGNELRRAPSLEAAARRRYGDDAVAAARSGQPAGLLSRP